MITKANTVAITSLLAALATSGIAIPAFAQTNQNATWDTCYNLAVERGAGPAKGGSDKVYSQNNAFMAQCMAGKIPLSADANAGVNLPAGVRASTVPSRRTYRHPVSAK